MAETAKTLEDLLKIHIETIPETDKVVEKIIVNNPSLTSHDSSKGVGINLGKLVNIAITDFLCFAFDKGDIGYQRTYPKN